MVPAEVLRQIRRLQLRARRAVQTLLGGEYHSTFKGSGLSFEEVREYQPGDDIRGIDWNVTARMGTPFIKRYVEERELSIILAVDVSASQRFGTSVQAKRVVAAELAALVAFCAISNNDRVGLLAFSDQVERYIPPNKGTRHVLRLLRDILFFDPEHKGTNLTVSLEHLSRVQHRRAIVFLLSDFLTSDDYTEVFRRVAKKHDLIAVRIADPRELTWPDVGLLQVEDAETGEQMLIDTSSQSFRDGFAQQREAERSQFTRLTRTSQVDLVDVATDGKHFDSLVKFFRIRERRRGAR